MRITFSARISRGAARCFSLPSPVTFPATRPEISEKESSANRADNSSKIFASRRNNRFVLAMERVHNRWIWPNLSQQIQWQEKTGDGSSCHLRIAHRANRRRKATTPQVPSSQVRQSCPSSTSNSSRTFDAWGYDQFQEQTQNSLHTRP